LALSLWALASCTPSVFLEPVERAERAAAAHNWRRADIRTTGFSLTAWEQYRGGTELAVYIEGDGYNWASRYQPSPDPSPLTPRVLEMAMQDPTLNRLYLARPCQYRPQADLATCDPHFWLRGRYAPQVVSALNQAIEEGKRRSRAERISIFGYSGGGALAVLVAARRSDVSRVVTVVANLDHHVWTQHHGVSALTDSLNPADMASALSGMSQVHFVGNNDTIVPRAVTDSYMRRLAPSPVAVRVIALPFDHTCCWDRDWPQLLQRHVYTGP